MKRTCLEIALGVVLLMTAFPFVASAQSEAALSQKTETNTPAGSKEVTLTLEGIFCGFGMFIFEGQTIRYEHSKDYYPTKVRIDGVPWDDLSKPFQLDFTPDFAKAAIVEKQARSIVELFPGSDSISLRINDYDIPAAYYMIKIAIKNQIKRPLPPPVNRSAARREPTMREIMDMEEKTAKMSKHWGPPINEPTDGMDHPDYVISSAVAKHTPMTSIKISGTVDRWACFRIQGNYVIYQNFSTPLLGVSGDGTPDLRGGKFASGVTVNGKNWDNLTKPFDLGFTPSLSSAKDVVFKAEQCEIEYAHHDDVIEISIANKGKTPTPFHVFYGIGLSPATKQKTSPSISRDPLGFSSCFWLVSGRGQGNG